MANELENPTPQETADKGQEVDVNALQKRIKELEGDNDKLRKAQTNASADASAWKKKYQDTMSEQDRAQAQRDEEIAAIQKERDDLRLQMNTANRTASLVGIGFDEEGAKAIAPALVGLSDEDAGKVFDGIRKFIATHDKEMAEKAIMNNPTLPGGNTTHTTTREEFRNMGYEEMVAFKREHPDLYKEYTNNS